MEYSLKYSLFSFATFFDLEEIIFENFNIYENNMISVKLAKVLRYSRKFFTQDIFPLERHHYFFSSICAHHHLMVTSISQALTKCSNCESCKLNCDS
jgi:hypothetical protein